MNSEGGVFSFFFLFLVVCIQKKKTLMNIDYCLLVSKMTLPNLRDTELCSQKKRRERDDARHDGLDCSPSHEDLETHSTIESQHVKYR